MKRLCRVESGDGARRFELYAHAGGRFSFIELALASEDFSHIGRGRETYWQAVYESGLYASAAAAQRDARAMLRWLCEIPGESPESAR